MQNALPVLGITMGDPAGIGPEICAKALASQHIYDICRPIIVGDAGVMQQAVGIARVPLKVRAVGSVADARYEFGTMDVLDLKLVDMAQLVHGKVSAMCGEAAFQSVVSAIKLALANEIDGTVTAPLNKASMNAAGRHFPGHTEIYAHYTGTKDFTMMLADGNLRVVHVSTHVSLRQACDLVQKERVLRMIKLGNDACKQLGIAAPRVGVAGLNPHAGEDGLFGWEEQREITPAIQEAKSLGINADGPIAPDTLFSKAKGGQYDIVVAMYHDQGHIPLKVVGFNYNDAAGKWESISGVNITLGLPIVRSSVDHGTAFGKAGKGTATEQSMVHAIEYGARLALYRKNS